MKLLFILLGLFWQTAAFAEVSDKMRSIPELIGQGAAVAIVTFLFSRARWWLALVALPVPALFFIGTFTLWQEVPMRQALIHEQSMGYFVAMLVADTLVLLGVVCGGVLTWRRRAAQPGIQADAASPRRLT